jgi:hypothetical protein
MSPERREVQGHLKRLLAWAGISFAAGVGISLASPGFGQMTAGWALINACIAAPGLRRSESEKPVELRRLREVLFLNQGLNAGYIGVGLTMAFGMQGWARDGGWAIVVQGAGLLLLDGLLIRRCPGVAGG